MTLGGKREGAGRKKAPHTIEAEKAREYIVQRVSEELEPIMDQLIAKAKKGDMAAIKDLLDRAYGRAKETVEHQGLSFLFDDKEDKLGEVVGKLV